MRVPHSDRLGQGLLLHIHQQDQPPVCASQTSGALGNELEQGVQLQRCSKILTGFIQHGQPLGILPGLLKQTRLLHGDGRLGSNALDELNVFFLEGTRPPGVVQHQKTDSLILLHQWHHQEGLDAKSGNVLRVDHVHISRIVHICYHQRLTSLQDVRHHRLAAR